MTTIFTIKHKSKYLHLLVEKVISEVYKKCKYIQKITAEIYALHCFAKKKKINQKNIAYSGALQSVMPFIS